MYKVTNVLKDGTILDSVEGIVIRQADFPELYKLLEKIRKEEMNENL